MFASPPDAQDGRQQRPKNNHKLTEKQTPTNKTKYSKICFGEAPLQTSQKTSQNDLPEPSGEGGERPKTTPRGARMAPGRLLKRTFGAKKFAGQKAPRRVRACLKSSRTKP